MWIVRKMLYMYVLTTDNGYFHSCVEETDMCFLTCCEFHRITQNGIKELALRSVFMNSWKSLPVRGKKCGSKSLEMWFGVIICSKTFMASNSLLSFNGWKASPIPQIIRWQHRLILSIFALFLEFRPTSSEERQALIQTRLQITETTQNSLTESVA